MVLEAGEASRKGWYHGWNIVAAAIVSQALSNGMPVNAFSLFLHDWSRDLNAPISRLQLGLASLGFVSPLLAPFVGVLADKKPARWLFGIGLATLALFHIGVSFATTSSQFTALFAVLLPIAIVFAASLPANAVVSRWFVRRRGLALGITAFGLGMAGVLMPPIIAALLPAFGWRLVWRGTGLFIGLVAAPLVMWVVRDRPTERDGLYYLSSDGTAPAPHAHGSAATSNLSWRTVLKRRNFWLLVITYLPVLALYGGCAQNLAPIAANHGFSQQTAGALLSAFSLSYVASSLTAGLLSDRFGNRLPLFGLAIASALGGLIFAFGNSLPMVAIGIVLVGLSGGLWPLLAAATANEFGAEGVGRGLGLLSLFVPVIALTPFAVAKVQEVTGSYIPGLTGLAVLTVIGGCACLLMREPRSALPTRDSTRSC